MSLNPWDESNGFLGLFLALVRDDRGDPGNLMTQRRDHPDYLAIPKMVRPVRDLLPNRFTARRNRPAFALHLGDIFRGDIGCPGMPSLAN